MRNQKERIKLQEKEHGRISVWDINFFLLHTLVSMSFLSILSSTPFPYPSDVLFEWPLRYMTITAKNTVISPNFQVWKFCGKEQFSHSFGESPETVRKLFFSIKFPHQEIRWNHDIFCSEYYIAISILLMCNNCLVYHY